MHVFRAHTQINSQMHSNDALYMCISVYYIIKPHVLIHKKNSIIMIGLIARRKFHIGNPPLQKLPQLKNSKKSFRNSRSFVSHHSYFWNYSSHTQISFFHKRIDLRVIHSSPIPLIFTILFYVTLVYLCCWNITRCLITMLSFTFDKKVHDIPFPFFVSKVCFVRVSKSVSKWPCLHLKCANMLARIQVDLTSVRFLFCGKKEKTRG